MTNTIKSDYVVYLDKNYNISETKSSSARYVVKLDNLRFNIASISCEHLDEDWTLRCRPTKIGQIEQLELRLPPVNNDNAIFHSRYYSVSGGIYDEFMYAGWGSIIGERNHSKHGRTFFDLKGTDITSKIELHIGTDVTTHVFSDEEKFQLEVLYGDILFLEKPRSEADNIVWHFNNINDVIKEYYKCKRQIT